ncbi:flippase [Enterococcus timonensis]|uniref:flippase n=1 Tax=Enterococcus timonensis TaxID=1852364 RepID=UPI0008DAC824|nr:flippase [Enterococcus timonensis]
MTSKKKTLLNLTSLGSIQVLNLLLPLITMPYIALVLGVDNYGLIGFAQSIMTYFLLVVDYGFNITATRQASINRHDEAKVNHLFTTVMVSKLLLTGGCFVILLAMMSFIPKMQINPLLYILYFGIVVGNALFPIWFFQGIEEMSAVGILNFVSKLIFTLGLFIFVKSSDDILLVAFLNALGYITIGLISWWYVRWHFKVRIVKIRWSDVKDSLKEGRDFFVTNMASSTFTTTNIFILGLLTTNTITGYFNLAFTVIRVCSTIALPIIQTFYPKLSLQYESSKEQAFTFVKKLLIVMTILFAVGCLILLFGARPILQLIFGDQFNHSIILIQIMAFLPLFYAWENTLGMLVMALAGFQKELSKMYVIVAIFTVALLITLTLNFGAIGTAISALSAEVLLTIFVVTFLKKKKVFLK